MHQNSYLLIFIFILLFLLILLFQCSNDIQFDQFFFIQKEEPIKIEAKAFKPFESKNKNKPKFVYLALHKTG